MIIKKFSTKKNVVKQIKKARFVWKYFAWIVWPIYKVKKFIKNKLKKYV